METRGGDYESCDCDGEPPNVRNIAEIGTKVVD